MKATIEIPDELYRRVKAKSALEGRAVREVTVDLFQRYLRQGELAGASAPEASERLVEGPAIPSWFGILGKAARSGAPHDMSAIRESIARGIARDREL